MKTRIMKINSNLKKILSSHNGVALMMILSAITLLTLVVTNFSFETRLNSARISSQQKSLQAKLNAESGLKLVFYIDPIPLNVINSITQSDNLDKFNYLEQNTPGQISVNLIKKELRKNRLKKISGFLTLYNGYSDFSNTDGQIFFPLEQDEQKIYLVITPNIKLKNILIQ